MRTGSDIICLYYHRVSPVKERLSIAPEIFRNQLIALRTAGYESISIDELINFVSGIYLPRKKPILLSFDDGFLDFYVYVFPLLKQFQMKAVVFLVMDWINDGSGNDFKNVPELGRINANQAVRASMKGDRRYFLSFSQVREMAKTGLVEFGSHGVSHRIGFSSERIRRFILSNNAHWKYWQAYEKNIKPGLPIFESASALSIRRFLPKKEAIEQMIEYCGKRISKDNREKRRVEKELFKLAQSLKPLGSYESEEEAKARILGEFISSKKMIESQIVFECKSLCWPFGDYSDFSIELAKKAGYKIAFTTERGVIHPRDESFALRRYRVSGVSGKRLVLELMAIKAPVLGKTISLYSRSRKVRQVIKE